MTSLSFSVQRLARLKCLFSCRVRLANVGSCTAAGPRVRHIDVLSDFLAETKVAHTFATWKQSVEDQ